MKNFLRILGLLLFITLSTTISYAADRVITAKWIGPDSDDSDQESAEEESDQSSKESEKNSKSDVKITPGMPAPKQGNSSKQKNLSISYIEPEDRDYHDLATVLKDSKGMDTIVEAVNEIYDFPKIDVVFDMCGQANAFYDSDTRRIILCYELVADLADGFRQDEELTDDEVGMQVISSLVFTFFHELGHAAVDVFDLPITGNEEDAVDRFATLILLSGVENDDDDLAENAIGSFDLETAESLEDLDFADEHPVDEQRWYTMACLMVGSNPEKYGYLVGEDGLPSGRAEACPAEFEKISKSWNTLMSPHLRKS